MKASREVSKQVVLWARHVAQMAVVLLSLAAVAACSSRPGASGPPTANPGGGSPASAAPTGPPSAGPGGRVTIYSGRSESLVGPLLERFTRETGITVDVKYAGTAELASTILEEGDNSPADVYLAQDAGALGAVAAEGRLAPLPADLLERVESRFRSPAGLWVGVSGRARVAVYSTKTLRAADLPDSILDFTDPSWKGRLGWAPTNGSFQAFVTALRLLEGEDAARAWLVGLLANEPRVYEGNDAIVKGVADGEIEVGFVNHYYLMRQLAEQGPSFPVANHFFAAGDPGALVNVAGAAILRTARNPENAQLLLRHLLSDHAQAYFAEETYEYPLVPGVPAADALRPLAEIGSPNLDLSDLADLEATLTLLRDTGVI